MALSSKTFGPEYRVYALLGDGEIEEGQVWEAAMFAGNHALDNLCVIVDNNGLQIDGTIEEVNSAQPIAGKFRAFGFHDAQATASRESSSWFGKGAHAPPSGAYRDVAHHATRRRLG